MTNENNVMVSIKCMVYNHEKYLRQCLDGFISQQTNFRFEAIVHDDASKDGSVSIIREYAEKYQDVIMPIYESENQYSKRDGSLQRAIDPHLTGKYIAICEGDDYWIDPLKLQKQVDFLESHPEYGLVYTAYKEDRNGELSETIRSDFGEDPLPNYLLHKGKIIATASTMCRAELYHNRPIDPNLPMADVPLWIHLMHSSKAKFLTDVTTVYRIVEESASHFKDYKKKMAFGLSAIQVRRYYAEKFGYKEIANALLRREKKMESLIDFYDLHLFHFLCYKPWRYGITLRDMYRILKERWKI